MPQLLEEKSDPNTAWMALRMLMSEAGRFLAPGKDAGSQRGSTPSGKSQSFREPSLVGDTSGFGGTL